MRWLIISALVAAACAGSATGTDRDSEPDTALIALTDLSSGTYRGHVGGLYPNGSNSMPAWHAAEGRRRAALIRPLDRDGRPAADGRIIMLSLSMSNGTQEFCGGAGYTACESWSFMGKARADASVDHTRLVIVNGARGGQVTERWASPLSAEYDRIRDDGLTPLGLTEKQVQVAWMKMANARPTRALPHPEADAYLLHAGLGEVLRAVQVRYPNLQMVFVSSRTYGGYATTALNPEPYAYETGFANKWLIEDQINQTSPAGAAAARAGNVDYRTGAVPWVAWGPYLWASGPDRRRSDGLFYVAADFQSDGTHPSMSGEAKVADLLLNFFKTAEHTSCWFLQERICP